MRVGRYLRILPETPDSTDASVVDLIITHGAFGSGDHETTVSCLEILEDLDAVHHARVLDLGSGTGILAIAALALGASSALCVDTSWKAVKTARRNCELNRVANKVRHVAGTLADVSDEGFDLVLANIYTDVLLSSAREMVERARHGATMVLSGIPWEDAFQVESAYRELGCELVKKSMLSEYCTLVVTTA